MPEPARGGGVLDPGSLLQQLPALAIRAPHRGGALQHRHRQEDLHPGVRLQEEHRQGGQRFTPRYFPPVFRIRQGPFLFLRLGDFTFSL